MTIIRPAHWTDFEQLVPIVEEFTALHHAMDPVMRPRWLGFTPAIFNSWLQVPDDSHLVAECGGWIAGYVWAGRRTGDTGNYLFMRRSVFVYVLAVAGDQRRRGIGRALFGAIEDEARAFDAEVIQLSVLPANDRAQAFYASLGYAATNLTMTKPLKSVTRLEGR